MVSEKQKVDATCEAQRKRGNPAWIKGKSVNPKGRPKGQNSFEAFCCDPSLFLLRHLRWERLCWALMEPTCTGAAAARKAGYSHKSARFIACRLLKKPVVREMFRRLIERVNVSREMFEGVWLIPDDSGKYRIYHQTN